MAIKPKSHNFDLADAQPCRCKVYVSYGWLIEHTRVEGVILAGGKSSRMGQNKSLVLLDKKPLIEHVFNRLKKQVSKLSINSNEFLSIFPEISSVW